MADRVFDSPLMHFAVFACAKSGTTWMKHLLNGVPSVCCRESRPFGRYFRFDPGSYSAPHQSLEQYLQFLGRHHEDAGDSEELLFDSIDLVAHHALQRSSCSVYGEKITPFAGTESGVVARLAEYNPELRFVHLVRDGRDVVVSGFVQQANNNLRAGGDSKWSRDATSDALEHRRVPQEQFEIWLDMWIGCSRAALRAKLSFPSWTQVRYEDLLDDTGRALAPVIEFLGVGIGADDLRRTVDAASFERLSGGRTLGSEDRSSFFRRGQSGDWRDWLTHDQCAQFSDQAGDLLTEFGYDPDHPPRRRDRMPAGRASS